MRGTRFRTGTITSQILVQIIRTSEKLLTVQVQVIAAVEETKAIGAGATTQSVLQNSREETSVDISDGASDSLLVAAGDNSVIATLGLGVLKGDILGERELNTVAQAGGGGHGHSGGSEEESGSEELHFDGLRLINTKSD